ncbi:unnamed protein product [Protopolystoma xenopodis]|uniref:Uncharacterized protein n=1 Tax=Protopolystoma xenopodis TaxID=117903 RepID=A0A3S5AMQ6_9PLAT|nr:unnamed protein product [Protopolystoma xenopodis]
MIVSQRAPRHAYPCQHTTHTHAHVPVRGLKDLNELFLNQAYYEQRWFGTFGLKWPNTVHLSHFILSSFPPYPYRYPSARRPTGLGHHMPRGFEFIATVRNPDPRTDCVLEVRGLSSTELELYYTLHIKPSTPNIVCGHSRSLIGVLFCYQSLAYQSDQ